MVDQVDGEHEDRGRITLGPAPDLPGVELLMAQRSERRWVVLHHTYTVCTVLSIDRPVPWRYRGQAQILGSDGVSLMEPGEVHVNTEVSAPATFRVLFVDPGVMEAAARELGVSERVHFALSQVDATSHPRLRGALFDLHASFERPATPLERESRFAASLCLLLEQCAEAPLPVGPPMSARSSTMITRAREFIEENLAAHITLQDVADAAGAASRFQLLRSFSAEFGLPPHAYQIQQRIAASKGMLARGMPAAFVAQRLGFSDQSHFARHFTRILGAPPATYARAVRRKNVQGGASTRRQSGLWSSTSKREGHA